MKAGKTRSDITIEKLAARAKAAKWYAENKQRAKAAQTSRRKKIDDELRSRGLSFYYAHKDKFAEKYKSRYQTVEGRAAFVWRAAKARAKRKGMEFTITSADVVALFGEGKCAISGIPFVFETDGTKSRHPFSPSLDRKDSKQGYTKENVRAICTMANFALSSWGDEAFNQFVAAVSKRGNN